MDGDTVRATVSLGWGLRLTVAVRLAAFNAPELREAGGVEARERLAQWLEANRDGLVVEVRTTATGNAERDRFGRTVGTFRTAAGVPYA